MINYAGSTERQRLQRNDKKSANETIGIITEWKDLSKWTPNTQREEKKNQQEKKYHT